VLVIVHNSFPSTPLSTILKASLDILANSVTKSDPSSSRGSERNGDISTIAALQNHVAATEERVESNKGDEQFDIGRASAI
jgi:hypothetical protein